MAKIPAYVFLIVGIVVVIVSSFKSELLLFRYVGVLLIIYGAARLIFRYITRKGRVVEGGDQIRIKQQGNQLRMVKKPHKGPQIHTFRCRYCSSVVNVTDNFCASCGYRLR